MSLAAMYPGRCCECGHRIEPGEAIKYYPAAPGGRSETAHELCPEPEAAKPPSTAAGRRPIELGHCSACGHLWTARPGRTPATSPCHDAPWSEEP